VPPLDSIEHRTHSATASPIRPRCATAFGKLIVEETEKWGKVIRATKIKPERN
jgi:hypothetical protein